MYEININIKLFITIIIIRNNNKVYYFILLENIILN